MGSDKMHCEDDKNSIQEYSPESFGRRRKKPEERKYMTVAEMGNLLGLKKTERYWLVHKHVFETREMLGKLWVDIPSFEKWYANQVKYHKVSGAAPGGELRKRSYSAQDIARMLDISVDSAYELIRNNNLETITVDYWKRVPKDVFDHWYAGQERYRNAADRKRDEALEARSVSMPEMARLLGITRKTVYDLLKKSAYRDCFEIVMIGEQKRIAISSFWKFLRLQDRYCLIPVKVKTALEKELSKADSPACERNMAADLITGDKELLTLKEAAVLAGTSEAMVSIWAGKDLFPVKRAGFRMRIPRTGLIAWLTMKREEGQEGDGLDQTKE